MQISMRTNVTCEKEKIWVSYNLKTNTVMDDNTTTWFYFV